MKRKTHEEKKGVKNVRFSENLACFVFLKHPFWDSLFYLITDDIKHMRGVYMTSIRYIFVTIRTVGRIVQMYTDLKIYLNRRKLFIAFMLMFDFSWS